MEKFFALKTFGCKITFTLVRLSFKFFRIFLKLIGLQARVFSSLQTLGFTLLQEGYQNPFIYCICVKIHSWWFQVLSTKSFFSFLATRNGLRLLCRYFLLLLLSSLQFSFQIVVKILSLMSMCHNKTFFSSLFSYLFSGYNP